MGYSIAKLVHLLSLVFWIGPPLGAYYFLYSAHRSRDPIRIVWAERAAEKILIAEHIAFALLIVSGAWMIQLSGGVLLSLPWLQKKLWLFSGVLLFEVADIIISHRIFARVLAEEDPLASREWPRLQKLRAALAIAALPVVVLLPAIFWIALTKS